MLLLLVILDELVVIYMYTISLGNIDPIVQYLTRSQVHVSCRHMVLKTVLMNESTKVQSLGTICQCCEYVH